MVDEIPRRRRRSRREPDTEPTREPGAVVVSAVPVEVEEDQGSERGLRGLVGGGSTQVSPGAALRARDATRPTAGDLAVAEATLVIIRRGWTPPPATPDAR